ncbi:uncharacterized protein [Coffea arabica]|uniref:Jacalin-type lectin domain-containing protein n=1 Tax=Coffea arabica TaxID=13443 RepID=A0A6P6UK44_COFAR|nr:uncharacterized protein LOC113712134 [Coffea arabica]
MEGTILPCKTVTPKFPEISQNPVKSRLPFKYIPRNAHLTIVDAHLTYLCRNGRLTEAIASLDSIAQCGSMVSAKTFSYLIQSCVDSQSIHLGRKLHTRMKHLLKDLDPFTETKIVGMYAKCGSLEDAYKMFDEMSERNLYAWSAMIGACTRERKWDEVVELFYLMMMEDGIVPDEFLFPKILQACGNSGDVETGRLIHGVVIKCGMNFQLRVNNAILAVYAKCGFSDLAKRFFDSMVLKDTVSWNSIITGYCQKGELEKARRFFELMREEGFEPSLVTWNILISSYSQLGKYDVVMEMMIEMQSCGILPDVFTWTCLISGFAQFNRKTEALECFEKMLLARVQPNDVTLISLLSMYASLKDLKKGRELHAWALKAGFGENLLVGNSLVDMYSKCAKVEAARQVFDMMSARDMYTWNSMIGGYCQAGYCGKAHDRFRKMRESDVKPTVITWNTLISGYMQNGDDDQAMDLFQRMEKDGHIKQDTASWNALIAGYLLTGNKDKALGIFRQMQSLCVKPNSFTILSILPACANLIAAKKVKELHCCVLRRNLDCELSVANSLIDTFAKSGNIKYSRTIFNSLLAKDIITWNTLIAGYVIHGRAVDAIELFNDMSHTELKPNRGTFVIMNYRFQEYGKHSISVGPWGGQDGYHWDDGVYSTVRQLVIAHGAGIDCIQIEYDRNGTSMWSEKHGGNGGAKIDKVRLDYPNEFLTSIHGFYGSLQEWGPIFIRSLTFESNKRSYGPYGIEQGTYFTFPMTQGKIVGFHGNCGWFLDAIGVHLEPLTNLIPSNSIMHSQNYVVQGAETYEYSMLQGNLGNSYDLILAVRQKGQYRSNSTPENWSRQTSNSSEFSRVESQNKDVDVVPSKISRVPSENVQGVMTYGPWGGNGGTLFDDGVYDGIREIHLSRNIGIVSIRVCYDLNGQPQWGSKNGGSGGYKSDKIVFNYPSEILTHITGHYGPAMGMGPNIIKSLTFHTTNWKHGPFGDEQGQSFSTKLRGGVIVGIHGRKGLFLDAIGVHVLEGKATPVSSSPSGSIAQRGPSINEADNTPQWSFKLGRHGLMQEAVQRVVKDPAPYGPGPWGGVGGKPWDDGVFTGIKQIILTVREAICSMEIEYDRNGQSVWSVRHGGNGGVTATRVKLEYPHEVLTRVSGYYGPVNKDQRTQVIKSLTFHTSRRMCGPFGEELGNYFSSTTTEGKVVGFHGKSGMYLDAIGVHMQHWLGNQRSSRPSYLTKIFS